MLGPRHDVPTPGRNRPVWTGTITANSATVSFQLSAWSCPGRRVMLTAQHIGGSDETRGTELFEHVRCLPPEEPAAVGSAANY